MDNNITIGMLYIMGPFGPECDLPKYRLSIVSRSDKMQENLLLCLWHGGLLI